MFKVGDVVRRKTQYPESSLIGDFVVRKLNFDSWLGGQMISLSKDGIEVPLTWKAEHFELVEEIPVPKKKVQLTKENVKVGDMVAMWSPEEDEFNCDIPDFEDEENVKLIDTFHKVEKIQHNSIFVNGNCCFWISRFYKMEDIPDETESDPKKITPEKIQKVKEYISSKPMKEYVRWALVNKFTKEIEEIYRTRLEARLGRCSDQTVKKVKVTFV
ncbi:MAG TPA: hypothetical protein VFM18_02685 [Methanosarcina sp.]|nr:hypothetical protein [Methanosarcina sp.]